MIRVLAAAVRHGAVPRRFGRREAGRWLWLGFLFTGAVVRGISPTPVTFQSGPGRFEVAAIDSSAARSATAAADAAWRWLTVPFGLPERFSSPVLVRLVPAAEWNGTGFFRVMAEPGGVVSVRVRWEDSLPDPVLRRAIVQGLLTRLAVAHHGPRDDLVVPFWLEQAALGWWRTRADPAQLDALKQASAKHSPPSSARLFQGRRGEAEPAEHRAGALWLLTFFQQESGGGEWPAFLKKLLRGDEPEAALAASYPGRFRDARERELWWQTGWHHLRRGRSLPTFEAEDSQEALQRLGRFVFAPTGGDEVLSLAAVLAHGREPFVRAEVERRSLELNRLLPALHPFYRNAGLSLGEAFAARTADGAAQARACGRFEGDWREAGALEAAANTALDTLEQTLGTPIRDDSGF